MMRDGRGLAALYAADMVPRESHSATSLATGCMQISKIKIDLLAVQ